MRDGNGTMLPVNNTWYKPVNGVLATAGDFQALYEDLISALTQSVSRDGQSPMTGNLQLGNNRITGLSAGSGTGQALSWEQLFSQGTEADIASAATTDIGAQNTNFLRVTGTTTITSFGTNYRGPRFLRFEGAVTLTNGTNLIIQGGANYTTAAGDVVIAVPKATLGTADGWYAIVPGAIANNSVTTSKIANNAVTPAKLANGGQELGPRNRLINAQGLINQRGYVSGTATTTANQYTVDRWRVVVSGQNLTFTTTNNETTFTAPAGGVEQVIEGLNLESGTYVLNWEGTATATVGGTSVAKGGTVTIVGGTNTTVRFIGGTFIRPQLEAGTVATPFERRPYGTELALCQRYAQTVFVTMVTAGAVQDYQFPQMRLTPTGLFVAPITFTGGTFIPSTASSGRQQSYSSVGGNGIFFLSAEL